MSEQSDKKAILNAREVKLGGDRQREENGLISGPVQPGEPPQLRAAVWRKPLGAVVALILLAIGVSYGPTFVDSVRPLKQRPDAVVPDVAAYIGHRPSQVERAIGHYDQKNDNSEANAAGNQLFFGSHDAQAREWGYVLDEHAPRDHSFAVVYVGWSDATNKVTDVRVYGEYTLNGLLSWAEVLKHYGFSANSGGDPNAADWRGTAKRSSNGRWYDVHVEVPANRKEYWLFVYPATD